MGVSDENSGALAESHSFTAILASPPLPELVACQGAAAEFAWHEFFSGQLRNPHTRAAYRHAVGRFLAWVESQRVELPRVTPGMVGTYLDSLTLSIPSKKLALAALRRFFDVMTNRHVCVLNPAASVRGERYQVIEGKTPEISVHDARRLLTSIPVQTVADRRDRTVIGILIYTAARVGALTKLRRKHFYTDGVHYFLRFTEKGNRSREIPVRDDLRAIIADYLVSTGLDSAAGDTPLIRSIDWHSGQATVAAATSGDLCRMVKRRLRAAGLSDRISPHSFRVCTVTDLLTQGLALEDVQHLVGHADPRTTRLYDRRQRRVTKNIVERISV